MPKLDRDAIIALGALFLLLAVSVAAPALALKARSDAAQALADEQDLFARFQAAHARPGGGKANASHDLGAAPESAFLNAQTQGLASAQLQAYLSQLVLAQRASLASSGGEQSNRPDAPDTVRLQATLEIRYDALQTLLYRLEAGTPYVFVDSMVVQPPTTTASRAGNGDAMKVTLNLRSLWHKTQP